MLKGLKGLKGLKENLLILENEEENFRHKR
jgi:hypothetical protein